MAIQLRRGAYANFDPAKMTPGEPAIVVSGDPNSSDGKSAYVAFAAGDVKRLATHDDMVAEITDITEDIINEVSTGIEEAIHDNMETASAAAATATQKALDASASAAEAAQTVATIIDPTLTQTGKAADAKKTGDEIATLRDDITQISEVIGSETIDIYDYNPITYTMPARTEINNGITFTQNANGTVTAVGTNSSSGRAILILKDGNGAKLPFALDGGKTYRITGNSVPGSCTLGLRLNTGGDVYVDRGEGAIFSLSENTTLYFAIAVNAGATIDATFKPEISERVSVGQKTIDILTAKDDVARDDLSDLAEVVNNFEGISDDVKSALLTCFEHVAWIDEHGKDYYDALEAALYSYKISSISVVYTQSGAVDILDTLDSLKSDLVVTATMKDSSTKVIPDSGYELSGTLKEGTSTITVTCESKTATFDVIVTDSRIAYELPPETVFDADRTIDSRVLVPTTSQDFTIVIKAKLNKKTTDDTERFILGWGALNNDTRAVIRIGVDCVTGRGFLFVNNYLYQDDYISETGKSMDSDYELIYIVRNSDALVTKRFYCDGAKMLDKSENVSAYSNRSNGGYIYIGARGSTPPTFRGTIHLLRIYNAALTDDEINNLLA